MELKGKYGSAIIYTDDVEQEAISQIYNMINNEAFANGKIRIMPDCHSGKGSVIGFTMELNGRICPSTVGVDIGCGVASWQLGHESTVGRAFDKLDKVIRRDVPSGKTIRDEFDYDLAKKIYDSMDNTFFDDFNDFMSAVKTTCKDTHQDYDYVIRSLGTLGGGNHFIEIDRTDNGDLWLTIHSGSRNFGLKVAVFHQDKAEQSLFAMTREEFEARVEEIKRTKKGKGIEVAIKALRAEASKKGKATGLEYLDSETHNTEYNDYLWDMRVAQIYARLNRRIMAYKILKGHYKIDYFEPVESVHNYINFEDQIVRKGAISAHKDERVIIPLNMADGVIIGTGKGNEDWNNSAPHGAGRRMSRSKAKASIRLEDFQARMKNVWSSTVGKSTLDEAPQAYKKADQIIEYLNDTVEIEHRMMPVYNFKASE